MAVGLAKLLDLKTPLLDSKFLSLEMSRIEALNQILHRANMHIST